MNSPQPQLSPDELRLLEHYRAELSEAERECLVREACNSPTAAYWKRKRQGWADKIVKLTTPDMFGGAS